ncbi:MAG: MBL fold metallo-hydrolase [Odoribacter sp.]|nr:MBL fold metallo-hydrolase [Odoribacter sp.]
MKLTILGSGTSQGIPVVACDCAVCRSSDRRDKRLRSSVLLEIGGRKIVIDAGPDFRYQMLRAGVKDIRAVLLTHGHKDHTGGLDDVRAFNWVKQGAVDIYGNENAQEAVYKDFSYAFAEFRYPGVPEIEFHLLDGTPFYIDDIRVVPIPVLHYRLPVLGFRIGDFAYITDAKTIPETSMELLKGVRHMVINALRKEIHLSHFNLEEALAVVDAVKPEQAWLTHIGHQMGFAAEVERELPAGVHLAYDMLEVEIPWKRSGADGKKRG